MRTSCKRKRLQTLTIIVFLILIASGANSAMAQEQPLVIEGATLIDGTGRAPINNSVIVLQGGRIKAAGAKDQVQIPPRAKVVNAENKFVLPGLIDAHIHFLDFMPQLFLRFGVTTIFDTANPTEWILAQREAQKRGRINGPRMFVTGLIIDGPNESGAEDAAEVGGYKIRVRNTEEARVVTRKVIGQGVDAVKVHEALSPELLEAVVAEAHKAGLEVVGHTGNVRESTRVGMKFVEHTEPITEATLPAGAHRASIPQADMDVAAFDSLVNLLVRNGVYFNPTLTRTSINLMPKKDEWTKESLKYLEDKNWKFIQDRRLNFWLRVAKTPTAQPSVDLAARRKLGLEKLNEFVRRYAAAGGKLITGPDTGSSSGPTNLPGLSMHVEMEALVDAGVTPMQAILASTRWPAELLHKEKDLGTVESGKYADILILDKNPLVDIRNTRAVSMVILDGKLVDTTIDPNFRNPIPRAVPVPQVLEYQGPTLTDVSPKIVKQGQNSVKLAIVGEQFRPNSIVRFDVSDLPTRFVDSGKLEAEVPPTAIKNVGTYSVTVVNPGSAGGTSNGKYLVVDFPN
jgi:imidazolonepropionase-like amidohydrolase